MLIISHSFNWRDFVPPKIMETGMKVFLLISLFTLFFLSCNQGKSIENDTDSSSSDELVCPDEDVEAEDDTATKSDSDRWWEAPVVKCDRDSDCPDPEKEFCDPYGECQCKRGVGNAYVVRYKGECMHGTEGNEYFCNGRSGQFYLNSGVPGKGAIGYVENREEVVCRCNFGFWGQHCENKIEYEDKMPDGSEYYMPDSDCKKDSDCKEGMKCGDTGYCFCDRILEFSDPLFGHHVKKALGLNPADQVSGKDLVSLKSLFLNNISKIEHGECFVNLRKIQLVGTGDIDFNEIAAMKNLQNIWADGFREGVVPDYSPLVKLEKLLFFWVDLNEKNYEFLTDMKSAKNILSLRLDFKGDYIPENLEFISNFSSLQKLILFNFDNRSTRNIDLSSLADNSILFILQIALNKAVLKGVDKLSEIETLIDLDIQLYKNKELQKISDFPLLPRLKHLRIGGVLLDIPVKDKFPEVTVLNVFGDDANYRDLSFLKGMEYLHSFRFEDDYADKSQKIDEGGYKYLENMTNLHILMISPYKNRSMNWIKNLKHLVDADISDVSNEWFPTYKSNYLEQGAIKSNFINNLLYLVYYRDRLFHIEELEGFVDYCKKSGAVCNKDFQKKYFFELELDGVGFNLCGNPITIKGDNLTSLQYLIEKGAYVGLGNDWGQGNCTYYSMENPPNITSNSRIPQRRAYDNLNDEINCGVNLCWFPTP
jgi:hypothetical protein